MFKLHASHNHSKAGHAAASRICGPSRAERRKREENGTEWKPRWFKLAAEADLHELELDVGTAVWEWNGAYNEGKAKRVENGIDNVLETEFDPWEFDDTKDMVIP